jgi:tetratricopeptide (TPR) repeat protein
MKTKITTTIAMLFILLVGNVNAQDAKYMAAMQTSLQQFGAAKTSADYVASANKFEQIGTLAKTEWLPYYYAALSQLINNNMLSKPEEKDAVLTKAQELIEKAEAINPAESEIFALKGYIAFMQIYVDPMTRMQSEAANAIRLLQKAKTLNPENPRPYYIIAQNQFYTPEAYGGGKNAAKPALQKAAAKFEAFKLSNPLMPNWGGDKNAELLAQCK